MRFFQNGKSTKASESIEDKIPDENKSDSQIESKRDYSYFIIKPDGVKYFPDIKSTIEEEMGEGTSTKYFLIKEYDETIKKLYYKHYQKESFSKSYEQYLNSVKSLFGNLGVLIVVSNTNKDSKEFFNKVLETKHKIRNKLIDPNVCAISNNPNSSDKNKVQIINEEGKEEKQRFFKDKGDYRISGFDVIHCPDSNKEDTNRELKILTEIGIISNENMFDAAGIDELLRFRSVYGFNGDWSEPRPDIAGFVEKEIKDLKDKGDRAD